MRRLLEALADFAMDVWIVIVCSLPFAIPLVWFMYHVTHK